MRFVMCGAFVLGLIMAALPAPAEARGGHYSGAHGSSHRGGSYRNAPTNNHYQHR